MNRSILQVILIVAYSTTFKSYSSDWISWATSGVITYAEKKVDPFNYINQPLRNKELIGNLEKILNGIEKTNEFRGIDYTTYLKEYGEIAKSSNCLLFDVLKDPVLNWKQKVEQATLLNSVSNNFLIPLAALHASQCIGSQIIESKNSAPLPFSKCVSQLSHDIPTIHNAPISSLFTDPLKKLVSFGKKNLYPDIYIADSQNNLDTLAQFNKALSEQYCYEKDNYKDAVWRLTQKIDRAHNVLIAAITTLDITTVKSTVQHAPDFLTHLVKSHADRLLQLDSKETSDYLNANQEKKKED